MPPGLQRLRPARWAGLLFVVALGCAIAISVAGGVDRRPRAVGVTVAADQRTDARDAAGSPLDMFDASLQQRDVRMVWRVTTPGTWKASDLARQPGRALCLMLARGAPAVVRGRVCVTSLEGHSALTYTPVAADGTAGTARKIGATVKRPRRSVLEATFLPVAAGGRVATPACASRSSRRRTAPRRRSTRTATPA